MEGLARGFAGADCALMAFVEVPKAPEEIVVNDGSVPESDMTNNVFKIESDAAK